MTAVAFAIAFFAACLAALRWPLVGVFAYMTVYLVAPDKQWWGESLVELGARFSLGLAVCTAVGLALNWTELKEWLTHDPWHTQETLVLLFVAIVLLSRYWGVPIDQSARDLSGTSETPAEKMPKIAVFVLMMTRLLVTPGRLRGAFLVLIVVGGLYIGWDGYTATEGRYVRGRLDALGGADFRESSAVAAHLAFVAVLIGVFFLSASQWSVKAMCVVAGAFAVNAIILTQTRAAILGLVVGGVAALFLVRREALGAVLACALLGGVGVLALTNRGFWDRAETIAVEADQRDRSAASRLELWSAGYEMWKAYPMGVGAGSFYTVVGDFDPNYAGRDCHNTYLRCLSEVGVLGMVVFAALIVNAFRAAHRANQLAAGTLVEDEVWWYSYGLRLGLIVYLTAGMFMGLTYIEETWWWLCLPVCLERAAANAAAAEMESALGPAAELQPPPLGDA
jgi:hypothetical protein